MFEGFTIKVNRTLHRSTAGPSPDDAGEQARMHEQLMYYDLSFGLKVASISRYLDATTV